MVVSILLYVHSLATYMFSQEMAKQMYDAGAITKSEYVWWMAVSTANEMYTMPLCRVHAHAHG